MKRPWYAVNARPLLEARKNGWKPVRPVIVSLIGGTFSDLTDTTLHVHDDMPIERMDWRMLVNIEVVVWANGTVPLDKVLQVVDGIARARPKRLVLRFEHKDRCHDVEIGAGFHLQAIREIPSIHEFLWMPITHTGSDVENRLRAALVQKHPVGALL